MSRLQSPGHPTISTQDTCQTPNEVSDERLNAGSAATNIKNDSANLLPPATTQRAAHAEDMVRPSWIPSLHPSEKGLPTRSNPQLQAYKEKNTAQPNLSNISCFIDRSLVGESHMVCFPLSNLTSAAALFDIVGAILKKDGRVIEAVTISVYDPEGIGKRKLPFKPFIMRESAVGQYTFEAFYRGLGEMEALEESQMRLLLSAEYE